jgi:hypothetical protein
MLRANQFYDGAKIELEIAEASPGFSPQSEHDIVFKNLKTFIEGIEFVFSINGIGVH